MDWGEAQYPVQAGTHKLEHSSATKTHALRRMKSKRATCYKQLSNHRLISFSLSPVFPPMSLSSPPLPSVHFTLNHFTTTLPFCQNTIFLLLFIVFLLQNMYRLFRTTTKIQYPIYMQFLSFNSYQFIRWILLEFLFLLIVPSPLSQMAYSPSEYWWAGAGVGRGWGQGRGVWRARYK